VYSHTENIRQTRALTRDDCAVQFRVTDFDHSAFSVRALDNWNNLPNNMCPIFENISQVCDH